MTSHMPTLIHWYLQNTGNNVNAYPCLSKPRYTHPMEYYAAIKHDDFSGGISNYTVWGGRGRVLVPRFWWNQFHQFFIMVCALDVPHARSERWSPVFVLCCLNCINILMNCSILTSRYLSHLEVTFWRHVR